MEPDALTLTETVSDLRDLQGRMASWRRAGARIGLVPTMGALHEGHLSLVREARARADLVVVSIFVNPKQFGPSEDFSRYPRVEAADREKLSGLADLIYSPGGGTMYPPGFATSVSVGGPSAGLEGDARPGHFAGVATVVAKLLLQLGPDLAIFGEKDWQQLQVVRRLVRDLDIPVEIVAHPTVRDEAGLALSSRNAFLSGAELEQARRLNEVLRRTGDRFATEPVARVLEEGMSDLVRLGFGPIDYLALCDAETLQVVDRLDPVRPARLLVAARLGAVRLIDNIAVALEAPADRVRRDVMHAA